MVNWRTEGFKIWRENGAVKTNVSHSIIHHSPDGFEFGYGGSGPADLALNILEDALITIKYNGERMECWKGHCFTLAFELHQKFKWAFIATLDRVEGGVIPFQDVVEFIEANKEGEE